MANKVDKIEVVLECQTVPDAEARLRQAFELLLGKDVEKKGKRKKWREKIPATISPKI